MNYKKLKTCLNNAIKRINKKGASIAWSYIKNYCENNELNIQEKNFIYKEVNKYLKKQNHISIEPFKIIINSKII